MIVQLISDLHLEVRPYTFVRAPGADVLVIAGDMAPPMYHGRLHNLLVATKGMPVILVAGNHDHYGASFDGHDLAELVAKFDHVTLLKNSYADIDGVRFVGGTMWTDFNLYGTQELSGELARRNISDFGTIAVTTGAKYRAVLPRDMIAEHAACLAAIEQHANARTVVVTHFMPLPQAIHPKWLSSPLNAYFCSDCSNTVRRVQPKLWCFGHTHSPSDFMQGPTRFLCNPRGYDRFENPQFNPLLTAEV